ncbi:MAG: family 43 glycosylhydrolase [Oscillospiraceae bacterium]|nr:family 43 glycosylhydrolase [Oscillospiraceae bacterium]
MREILIPKEDLVLKYSYKTPEKIYGYKKSENPSDWQAKCREKLKELIVCDFDFAERPVEIHHTTKLDFGMVHSLIMQVDETLSIPAYLLIPEVIKSETPVIAVQGHGYIKGVLGIHNDYHHAFGVELCRAGFVVLVPEIRGFGDLVNLSAHIDGGRLIYYNWGELMAYTLVTDAFQKGYTLIGDTVQDLYAWGSYICGYTKQQSYSVAGISYGGDLSLILSALDERVDKTFASGTLGSMTPIFERCYNAPAHCIPNILKYMDRQEIASCIAPRSLCVHYGELDVPSPENSSAAFNETAIPAYNGVKRFYGILGVANKIQLAISPDMKHEMDNSALIDYLQGNEIKNILKMEDIFKKKPKERKVKPDEFCNAISGNGANTDPYVIFINDWYYGTCTYDGDGQKSIVVYRANHLQDLFNTTPITVFNAVDGTDYSCDMQAPEIHYLAGNWYIYFAAKRNDANKCHVIQGGTDPNDPLSAPYHYMSELSSPNSNTDASIITINEKHYLLSACQTDTGKCIAITEMINPWTLNPDTSTIINTPEYAWEKQSLDIVEAPEALYKDGKIMIIYSASAVYDTGCCLGMLTYNQGDPLLHSSWDKQSEPVFKSTNTVWGASHACFTTSLDGKEDWIVYHAKVYNTSDISAGALICNIRAQKFTWNRDGTPNFGEPVETGTPVREPSGTKHGRVVCEVEGGIIGGNAKIIDDALSSGGKKVRLDKIGDFVQLDAYIYSAGYYTLTILYHNTGGDIEYKSLYINDEFIERLDFPGHCPMTNPSRVTTVLFKQHMNSIKFLRDTNDSPGTDIDCFIIEKQ